MGRGATGSAMIWTYRTIFKLLNPEQKRRFLLLVALMLAMGVLDLCGVAMILPFLAVLANPEIIADNAVLSFGYEALGMQSTYAFLEVLGLATFVLVMSGITVRALSFYLSNLFARHTSMTLGMARLMAYISQPYEWFLQQHSADLAKSVLQEMNEIVSGTVTPALRLVGNLFLMVALVGLLLVIEPVGAIGVGLLFGASFWLVDRAVRTRIHEMGIDRRRANRERQQVTGEVLSGIREVKMMGLESMYRQRFFDPSKRLASYQARLQFIGEMPRFALEAMTFGGMLLFTLWLLWTSQGTLDGIVPVLGAFAFAGLRLMPTVQVLFRDIAMMRFGKAALEALRVDLMELPASSSEEAAAGGAPIGFTRELRLEHVSYAYPESRVPAVTDLNLTIRAGTAIGFVGATGAGKSTVIDLILGLVPPREGRLVVDGVAIGDDNRQAWRHGVGFVPQSIHLVDDSVAANIAYGIPFDQIDPDRVRQAARMASVHDTVEALPEGYDTFIGERGVRLSGGQRQRIGIARALYRGSDLLVLDEATSALDTVTETEVMSSVRHLHGETTLILVSHRLSTLAHCDRIYVLDRGRIVASGSYEEMRRGNTAFQAMLEAAT